MNFISGADAGRDWATKRGNASNNAAATLSAAEGWDNDDDFDLSVMRGNALKLPRSAGRPDDHTVNDSIPFAEAKPAPFSHNSIEREKQEQEDWNADFDEDEDKGDTIKVSSIADTTLAQLAALRKNNASKEVERLSRENDILEKYAESMVRTDVSNIGSRGSHIMAGGDWDEDLEVPDTFPTLRPLGLGSGFASDIDTPSLGSTSDALSSGSVTGDVRQRSLTQSSYLGSHKDNHSSTSSVSSSFTSSPRKEKGPFSEAKHAKAPSQDQGAGHHQEEGDFDLPTGVLNLRLTSSLSRQKSAPMLEEQQHLFWEERGKRSSSPGHASASDASAKESDAEEDNMLDGLDFPDLLFAKTKAESPNAVGFLQARLDARKSNALHGQAVATDDTRTGTDRDGEFSQGLIITDDLDLSPSRLKSKKLSNSIREAAHQRRGARDPNAPMLGAPIAEIGRAGYASSLPLKREAASSSSRVQVSAAPVPAQVSAPAPVIPRPARGKNRRSKRKQPMLIRNLGGPSAAPRVEGDMKWNPRLQRWEGNEEEGRSLENAVKGSGRPALIAHLSVGSANVVLGPASKGFPTPSHPTSPPAIGARVVGDMVFDPIRLRWSNKNVDEEEDPFAAMNDDDNYGDDDDDGDRDRGVAQGDKQGKWLASGKESMNRNSLPSSPSVSRLDPKPKSAAGQWTEAAINKLLLEGKRQAVPIALSDRIPSALWSQCLEAKTRHEEEVAPFFPKREASLGRRRPPPSAAVRDRRSHLYMIQMLARKAMPD